MPLRTKPIPTISHCHLSPYQQPSLFIHANGNRHNYRATHPVNAMLNYAYGVITARTQVQLISDGYDPTVGILHDKKHARGTYPAFALDHIEPMRPVVDRAILELIKTEAFSGADFSVQDDGVCRLNPELARRVAQLALEVAA